MCQLVHYHTILNPYTYGNYSYSQHRFFRGISLRVLGLHPFHRALRPALDADRLHGGGGATRGKQRLPDVLRTETRRIWDG